MVLILQKRLRCPVSLIIAAHGRRRPALRWSAVLAVLFLASAFPGCLNDFEEERLNRIWIDAIDVSAPKVGSGTLTLVVNVTIDNRDAGSGDLTLQVKAHNTVTGLLVKTEEVSAGTIDRDETKQVPVALDLPKEDGYRLSVYLDQDGKRVARASGQVHKVGALANTVVASGLHVKDLEFLVRNVTSERVRIEAQVYLTNEAAEPSHPLELQLKAREVSTGLLAAEEWTNVSGIPSEATRIRTLALEVPAAYNYLVEAVLWDGDFIVGKGQGKVQLLPTFTVPKDEEVVVERPTVEDFMRDEHGGRGSSGSYDEDEAASPGPAVILLVVAIAAIIGWTRRRT